MRRGRRSSTRSPRANWSPSVGRASSGTATASPRGGRCRPRSWPARLRSSAAASRRRSNPSPTTLSAISEEEGRLLSEGIDFPPLQTRFRDRHALVVARGPGHKRDLRIVRPYIRDFKPVLIGVDGGADALLEAGY